jgi:hypothetical protein
MSIRICQEIESGHIVMVYDDGHTLTFFRPTDTYDAMEIAEATSPEPEVQREVALALIRTLSLLPAEPAPDPVPAEEGGEG